MPTDERARLRSVKRLFDTAEASATTTIHSTGTAASAAQAEPCPDDPSTQPPPGNEHLEYFQVLLSAGEARHLRALADHERTIASDLIRRWVCERLEREDFPHDPLGGRPYPPNVIPLPYVR